MNEFRLAVSRGSRFCRCPDADLPPPTAQDHLVAVIEPEIGGTIRE
jgi:hypothetical protein